MTRKRKCASYSTLEFVAEGVHISNICALLGCIQLCRRYLTGPVEYTDVNSTLVSLRRVFHFDDKNDERTKKVAEGIMLNKKEENHTHKK